MRVDMIPFGIYDNESYVEILVTNDHGLQISFSDLGARINRWGILKNGRFEQIILGHRDAAEVFKSPYFFGGTIGRVAGRIDKGEFDLDGNYYTLDCNEGVNHLHGGQNGYNLKRFDFDIKQSQDKVDIIFTYLDQEKVSGYPGDVTFTVIHSFNNQNEWTVTYKANTTKTTIINPTNHVYFNLNGNNIAPVLNHEVFVDADYFLPLEADGIPVGNKKYVERTPFDFRTPRLLQESLSAENPQLALMKGIDHPFMLNQEDKVLLSLACSETNYKVDILTDRSAAIIYTLNKIEHAIDVWDNPLQSHSGIAIETQEAPNAINMPGLGDIRLEPHEEFYSQTTYRLCSN